MLPDMQHIPYYDTQTSACFTFAGQQYSCDDIENGVLRANRKPVVALGPLFGPRDPRLACVMPEVDQRLHFALNCGASSCPAVKYYTAENVDDELTLAAQVLPVVPSCPT